MSRTNEPLTASTTPQTASGEETQAVPPASPPGGPWSWLDLPAGWRWLGGLGVSFVGGLLACWPNLWSSLTLIAIFVAVMSLLGAVLLRSWWALAAIPAASIVGGIVSNIPVFLAYPPQTSEESGMVLAFAALYALLLLVPGLVGTALGVAVGKRENRHR